MSLEKFKFALVVAMAIVILGILVVLDNPINRNPLTVIALLILGCGSIIVETLHPFVALPLLGFIGFSVAVAIQRLIKGKKWLELPLAIGLSTLLFLNTVGLLIWLRGRVEGYW